MTFHFQINGQIKRQNSIIELYLQAFVNCKHNNWAKFLPMMEFIYKNTKNDNTGYISFTFNSGYYFYVFFEDKINQHSRFCSADELA